MPGVLNFTALGILQQVAHPLHPLLPYKWRQRVNQHTSCSFHPPLFLFLASVNKAKLNPHQKSGVRRARVTHLASFILPLHFWCFIFIFLFTFLLAFNPLQNDSLTYTHRQTHTHLLCNHSISAMLHLGKLSLSLSLSLSLWSFFKSKKNCDEGAARSEGLRGGGGGKFVA